MEVRLTSLGYARGRGSSPQSDRAGAIKIADQGIHSFSVCDEYHGSFKVSDIQVGIILSLIILCPSLIERRICQINDTFPNSRSEVGTAFLTS